MPVYIPNKAVFVHVPKCGGTTVSKFMFDQFGRHIQKLNGKKTGHIPTGFIEKDLIRFSFIRDPHTWWESVWKMLMSSKPSVFYGTGFQPLAIVHPLIEDDYNKFMHNVINRLQGFYTELLTWYLGKDLDGLEFIGRTEHLKTDLGFVLEKIGAPFSKNRLNMFPNYGVRKKNIQVSDEVTSYINETESRVFELMSRLPICKL